MTSIPYSRFYPLQFEAGWITIGANKSAPKGKKGGVPVKVKDGRIVAGPAALQDRKIGNLNADAKPSHPSPDETKGQAAGRRRQETMRGQQHANAARRRAIRKAGLNPNQVQAAYEELKQHDAEHVEMHNRLIRTAYKSLGVDRRHKVLEGEDWASIPGGDQVARELSTSEDYQFLFKSRGDEVAAAEEGLPSQIQPNDGR